jgi:hypothetical protein
MVCKAYGAEIASYGQVEQAYNAGAEWCGYGWSDGGIALYPTQQATWDKMQKDTDPAKRIKCGRPGINGGYFDPKTKFGVNCYGTRPKKPSGSVPSTDPMMDKLMAMLKKNLSSFVVQPFNSKMWAENPAVNIQSSQTPTPSAAPVPGATQPTTTQATTPASPAVTSTLLSAKPTVPEAPKVAPTVTSTSTLTDITGTDPIGVISDLFNNLEQTASNFIN